MPWGSTTWILFIFYFFYFSPKQLLFLQVYQFLTWQTLLTVGMENDWTSTNIFQHLFLAVQSWWAQKVKLLMSTLSHHNKISSTFSRLLQEHWNFSIHLTVCCNKAEQSLISALLKSLLSELPQWYKAQKTNTPLKDTHFSAGENPQSIYFCTNK